MLKTGPGHCRLSFVRRAPPSVRTKSYLWQEYVISMQVGLKCWHWCLVRRAPPPDRIKAPMYIPCWKCVTSVSITCWRLAGPSHCHSTPVRQVPTSISRKDLVTTLAAVSFTCWKQTGLNHCPWCLVRRTPSPDRIKTLQWQRCISHVESG